MAFTGVEATCARGVREGLGGDALALAHVDSGRAESPLEARPASQVCPLACFSLRP